MSTQKTRLVLPDVLKGLAVVLMIHAHIMEQFVNPVMFESALGKIAMIVGVFPGAAVFMIIMGYFVGFSNTNPLRLVKRGFLIFGGGILLNILLNFSYIIVFIKTGYSDLILGSILGVDILLLAGLSLIIIGGLKRISVHPLFWIGISLAVLALSPWINQMIDGWDKARYITAFIGGTAEWSYFPLFPWLAYPLTGMAVYAIGFKRWKLLPVWGKGIILGASLVGFILGLKMGFDVATTLSAHYHHGMLYFFWILSFIILLVFFLNLINIEAKPIRTAFLGFLGREVTLVYVIQWILIGNLAPWLGKKTLFAGHLAWTLSIILASALLAFVYRRIILNNKD